MENNNDIAIIEKRLIEAIEKHDLKEIQSAVGTGMNLDFEYKGDKPGRSPLIVAIQELYDGGSIEAVRLLIEAGASVNFKIGGCRVSRAIHAAVYDAQREATELLLRHGADPNPKDDEGGSPLYDCVQRDDIEMAKLLLRHGATNTINEWSGFECYTPLGLAAHLLHPDMIRLLVEAGANLNTKDEDGKIALERLPERTQINARGWDLSSKLLTPSL